MQGHPSELMEVDKGRSESSTEMALCKIITVKAHLKRVTGAFLLQNPWFKYLPDEPLGIVDGVLLVSVGQFHRFMSRQYGSAGEGDGARDAHPPLFICYHLHLPAARMEDSD